MPKSKPKISAPKKAQIVTKRPRSTKAETKRVAVKAVSKKRTPKQAAQSAATVQLAPADRRLRLPTRHWYRRSTWRRNLPRPIRKPIGKSRLLLARMYKQIFTNWKLFGGIILIYGLLNLLLVRGLSGSADLGGIKSTLDQLFTGSARGIESAGASFLVLLTSSGSNNTAAAGPYQAILLVVSSLALIWALRQTIAEHTSRIRDSFYQGMYALVPFVLVCLVIAVQLLPLVAGSALFNLIISAQIATDFGERAVIAILCLLPIVWTFRMLIGSVFALYIVTLPGMTPLKALRTARELVYKRRLLILRKLLLLPTSMVIIAAVIELPLIAWVTPVAEWVFFALSTAAIVYIHAYLYGLYRELI